MVVRFSSSHSSTLENDVGRSKGRDVYSRVPFVTKVQTLSTWGNNETPVALGKTRISCTHEYDRALVDTVEKTSKNFVHETMSTYLMRVKSRP